MTGVRFDLVLDPQERHLALRVDLGVFARGDGGGLDGDIAARIDGDVAAGGERRPQMGGARRRAGQLRGLDADAAARIEVEVRARAELAAHAVDVFAGVERHAVRGADRACWAAVPVKEPWLTAARSSPNQETVFGVAAAAPPSGTPRPFRNAPFWVPNRACKLWLDAPANSVGSVSWPLRLTSVDIIDGLGVDRNILALDYARQVLDIARGGNREPAAGLDRAQRVHHLAGGGDGQVLAGQQLARVGDIAGVDDKKLAGDRALRPAGAHAAVILKRGGIDRKRAVRVDRARGLVVQHAGQPKRHVLGGVHRARVPEARRRDGQRAAAGKIARGGVEAGAQAPRRRSR